MTNARWCRVGDSPLIGSGTYANSGYCGVSCTGEGEAFIKRVVAYDVCARMKYGGVYLACIKLRIRYFVFYWSF